MLQKWRYGNYNFINNPKSANRKIELVGDDIVTQSGKVISLPTTYQETIDLSADFYQGSTQLIAQFAGISGCKTIAYSNNLNRFYLITNSGMVYVKSSNWSPIENFQLINVTLNATGATVIDNYLYILKRMGDTGGSTIVKVDLNTKVETVISVNYNYWNDIDDAGITGTLYGINYFGIIYSINLSTGVGTIVWDLDIFNEIPNASPNYIYYSLSYDGKYHWTFNKDTGIFYQLDIPNKKIINSFETKAGLGSDGTMTFMPSKFIYYNDSITKLVDVYRPNTVLADLYTLEQEIMKGKVTMVDDFGVRRDVAIVSYNKQRKATSEVMYEVNMTVHLVDE